MKKERERGRERRGEGGKEGGEREREREKEKEYYIFKVNSLFPCKASKDKLCYL